MVSSQRCASGAGGARNTFAYAQGAPTPGAPPPFSPAAEFSGSPSSGVAPLTTSFVDLSCGNVTSWSWDFGDGGTSNVQNPNHTYTSSGTYTVSLTASGPGGSDGETKTNYITVAAAAPVAEFA
ncbi:MAG: PKD domain-containing protein, partial [bacterium]|nr:PKD domain-containing protein [bacterium]